MAHRNIVLGSALSLLVCGGLAAWLAGWGGSDPAGFRPPTVGRLAPPDDERSALANPGDEPPRGRPDAAPSSAGSGTPPGAAPPELPAQGPAAEADAAPGSSRGCTLRGIVYGPDGEPAATDGTFVEAVDAQGRARSSRVDRGEYAVTRLVPGRWWVTARVGEREVEELVTIAAGEAEHWLDITLPAARIVDVFVVAPDGTEFGLAARQAGVRQASRLVAVATAQLPRSTTLDDELVIGRVPAPYRRILPGFPWGTLALDEEGGIFVHLVLGDTVVATEAVPAGEADVTLVLDPRELSRLSATLRLRVVDAASGAPLTDGVALLSYEEGMHGLDPGEPGEPGTFVATDCPPGAAHLRLDFSGSGALERELVLRPGETLDLGTIPLGDARYLAGRVAGAPPGSRKVHLVVRSHWPEDPARRFPASVQYGVEADRSFRCELGAGYWVVSASDGREPRPSLSPNYLVDLRAASVEGLSVELVPSFFVVLSPRDATWDGGLCTIVDSRGLERARTVFSGTSPRRVVLPPGEYVLRVQLAEAPDHAQAFRVAGEDVQLAVPE